MASWLLHLTLDRAVQVGALAVTLCCVLGKHTLLAVRLSTQVYKWVPESLMLELTLQWTTVALIFIQEIQL